MLKVAGGGGGSGSGTVTQIDTGTGLTGGPITTTGTVALANTAVVAGTYGNATTVAQITVDAQGRLTFANNVTISASNVITATSVNAFAVGRQGTTDPAFNVNTNTANSATGVNITAASAGNGVAVSVLSSGANEALTVNAKGTGTIGIGSVSTGAVTITPATTISGAATLSSTLNVAGVTTVQAGSAAAPAITTSGDADTGIYFPAADTIAFSEGGAEQVRITATASAVNRIELTGSATGANPNISAAGTDTNISLNYTTKGTGGHAFRTAGSVLQFSIVNVASAVNYWEAAGGAAGAGIYLAARGTDTNVSMTLTTKGTGVLSLQGGNFSCNIMQGIHTASAVNFLRITNSVAASAPSLSSQGTDTNIDLILQPKGTGILRTGYATTAATVAAAFSAARILAFKDSSGTTYYIPAATATW